MDTIILLMQFVRKFAQPWMHGWCGEIKVMDVLILKLKSGLTCNDSDHIQKTSKRTKELEKAFHTRCLLQWDRTSVLH